MRRDEVRDKATAFPKQLNAPEKWTAVKEMRQKGGSLGCASWFSALDNTFVLALLAAPADVLTRREKTLHLVNGCD